MEARRYAHLEGWEAMIDMDLKTLPQQSYWAAEPAEDLVAHLQNFETRYFEAITEYGFGQAWLGAYCAYYGLDPESFTWESNRIGFDGEEGELLRFRINEARSYIRQMGSMSTGQRPSFECEASNNDYDVLTQIETADAAVNQIYWEKYGELREQQTIIRGDLFGISRTWVYFDPDGGDEVDVPLPLPPDAGGGDSPATQKGRTGDIVMKSLAPWQTFCDPYKDSTEELLWMGARVKESKWEVVAQLRNQGLDEEAERVVEMSGEQEHAIESWFGFRGRTINPDELIVKYWYHDKTAAMPDGRYVRYVKDVVIYDGPLPGRRLPFEAYMPGEYIGTAFGYTEAWDIIPINQMADQLASDIATNLSTFGRQSVWVDEDGGDLTPQDLANGMSLFVGGSGPPQPISLATMPPAAEFFLAFLEKKYQAITGLNSVSRGQPDANITSGEMAALFHSIASEVNGFRQLAVDNHRERTANLLLETVQDNIEHPLIVSIAGNDQRSYSQELPQDAFTGIRKIKVKTANPMLRSTAGRLELAKLMMQVPGAVTAPQQIDELLVSGQLRPLYKAPRAEMLRISWENEELAKAPPVQMLPDPTVPPQPGPGGQLTPAMVPSVPSIPVLPTDNPQTHISEHMAILSGRDAMAMHVQATQVAQPGQPPPPTVVAATLAHIQDHIRKWRAMDPALASLLGFPPPPNPMAAAMGMEGDAGAEGPPETGGAPEPKETEGNPLDVTERDSTGTKIPQPSESPMGGPAQ